MCKKERRSPSLCLSLSSRPLTNERSRRRCNTCVLKCVQTIPSFTGKHFHVQPGAVHLVLRHHWMHVTQVRSVLSENQFHCTCRLYMYMHAQGKAVVDSNLAFVWHLSANRMSWFVCSPAYVEINISFFQVTPLIHHNALAVLTCRHFRRLKGCAHYLFGYNFLRANNTCLLSFFHCCDEGLDQKAYRT